MLSKAAQPERLEKQRVVQDLPGHELRVGTTTPRAKVPKPDASYESDDAS